MCSSCGMGMLEWWNQSATSRGKEVQFQIHWVERPCEKWFSSPWPVARLKNASCVQKDRFWTWCRVVVNRFGTCAQSPLLQMEGFSEVKLVLCWMSLHWVIVNRYMDDYGCTMIYTTSVTYLPMHNSLSIYIHIQYTYTTYGSCDRMILHIHVIIHVHVHTHIYFFVGKSVRDSLRSWRAEAMVTMASTIYHGFQLHPVHGPLNHTTRCACVTWLGRNCDVPWMVIVLVEQGWYSQHFYGISGIYAVSIGLIPSKMGVEP